MDYDRLPGWLHGNDDNNDDAANILQRHTQPSTEENHVIYPILDASPSVSTCARCFCPVNGHEFQLLCVDCQMLLLAGERVGGPHINQTDEPMAHQMGQVPQYLQAPQLGADAGSSSPLRLQAPAPPAHSIESLGEIVMQAQNRWRDLTRRRTERLRQLRDLRTTPQPTLTSDAQIMARALPFETGVFDMNLEPAAERRRKRRKYTFEEREAIARKRKVGVCDRCKKGKRRCTHVSTLGPRKGHVLWSRAEHIYLFSWPRGILLFTSRRCQIALYSTSSYFAPPKQRATQRKGTMTVEETMQKAFQLAERKADVNRKDQRSLSQHETLLDLHEVSKNTESKSPRHAWLPILQGLCSLSWEPQTFRRPDPTGTWLSLPNEKTRSWLRYDHGKYAFKSGLRSWKWSRFGAVVAVEFSMTKLSSHGRGSLWEILSNGIMSGGAIGIVVLGLRICYGL